MDWVQFNPSDVQSIGIGLAAFLASILAVYVYLSARREPLGRAMWLTLSACAIWAWFGFLYHIVADISIAREMRVVSVMGIVGISVTEIFFALTYLGERVRVTRALERIRNAFYVFGAALAAMLCLDLIGSRFIVGDLELSPSVALAPEAGPLMGVLIAFYAASTAFSGVLLAWRARVAADEVDRRRALLLFGSMTVGLFLGGTRFTPWYGFDFYPLIGDIGFPLFTFAALYSITRYRLFNLEAAAAQALILVIWAVTFFRILLEPSLSAAALDIGLFAIALLLGVLLMHSIISGIRTQKELARLTIERTKGEFVTIAAHQLRTPITAIRWVLGDVLSDKAGPLSAEHRAMLTKASRAADAMLAIANDLLNTDRISSGTFTYDKEPSDVQDTIRVAVAVLNDRAIEKGIHIDYQASGALPQVSLDRGKMAMALENVIDNAIKYSQRNSRVVIQAVVSGARVRISVQDEGIGIADDERPRIFERFFRSPRAMKMHTDGSGLGLYVAKTIVEGHGGTLSLASRGVDAGTRVEIELPVTV